MKILEKTLEKILRKFSYVKSLENENLSLQNKNSSLENYIYKCKFTDEEFDFFLDKYCKINNINIPNYTYVPTKMAYLMQIKFKDPKSNETLFASEYIDYSVFKTKGCIIAFIESMKGLKEFNEQ